MLENYAEQLVRQVLKEYKQNNKICECETCEDDIVAIALNNIKPKYFISSTRDEEKIAYIVNKPNRLEALIKIAEAVSQVCND